MAENPLRYVEKQDQVDNKVELSSSVTSGHEIDALVACTLDDHRQAMID